MTVTIIATIIMATARRTPTATVSTEPHRLDARPDRLPDDGFAGGVLGTFVAFALLDGVLRARVQRRRTGDSGVRRPVSVEQWAARLTFAAGLLATGAAGPVVEFGGGAPLEALDRTALRRIGLGLAAAGVAAVFAAQQAMGDSWRTTVAPHEQPALVTTGPFRHIRNPIYTAVMAMAGGFTLAVPNPVSLAGFTMVVVGSHWQVRRIEEPYLLRTHPQTYPAYAQCVGRFFPRAVLAARRTIRRPAQPARGRRPAAPARAHRPADSGRDMRGSHLPIGEKAQPVAACNARMAPVAPRTATAVGATAAHRAPPAPLTPPPRARPVVLTPYPPGAPTLDAA